MVRRSSLPSHGILCSVVVCEAFEKAGFKNALEVKVQPDDADWDAGDIRYNVLRWTSSPNPPFGGYGPSMTNPRTGEIIGADIMLEFVHFTNRVFYNKLVGDASKNMNLENDDNLHDHTSDHVQQTNYFKHQKALCNEQTYFFWFTDSKLAR